jgi:hypothetical protein
VKSVKGFEAPFRTTGFCSQLVGFVLMQPAHFLPPNCYKPMAKSMSNDPRAASVFCPFCGPHDVDGTTSVVSEPGGRSGYTQCQQRGTAPLPNPALGAAGRAYEPRTRAASSPGRQPPWARRAVRGRGGGASPGAGRGHRPPNPAARGPSWIPRAKLAAHAFGSKAVRPMRLAA